jgi:hypothetical protein
VSPFPHLGWIVLAIDWTFELNREIVMRSFFLQATLLLQTSLLLPRAQKLAIKYPHPGQIFDHDAAIGIHGYLQQHPGEPFAIEVLLDDETLFMDHTATFELFFAEGFAPGKHTVSVPGGYRRTAANVIAASLGFMGLLQIVARTVGTNGTVLGAEEHASFEVRTLSPRSGPFLPSRSFVDEGAPTVCRARADAV